MKNLLLAAALLFAPALAAQNAKIYAPANGTTLQAGAAITVQWNKESGVANAIYTYYLQISTVGFGKTDAGFYATNALSQAITVPTNGAPFLYFTLGQYAGSAWYTTEQVNAIVSTAPTMSGSVSANNPTSPDANMPAVDPGVLLISPNSGSGLTQTFSALVSDTAGYGDINQVWIQFNGPLIAQPNWYYQCNIVYVPGTGINISDQADNDGTYNPIGPAGPPSWASDPDGVCFVDVANTTVSGDGTNLTLTMPVSFVYPGSTSLPPNVSPFSLTLQGYATSATGLPAAWNTLGTWTVAGASNMEANYKTMLTAQGETLRIKRGDNFQMSGPVKYSFTAGSPSSYTYTLDNRQVAHIRLGIVPEDTDLGATDSTAPDGWLGDGPATTGWDRWIKPTSSEKAQYTLTSTKLPGLMPLFLQSDYDGAAAFINGDPIPAGIESTGTTKPVGSKDQNKFARLAGIFENSQQRMVIGPAFEPAATLADVMKRVKVWARSYDGYGFAFLAPLVKSSDPRAALDTLKPTTPLERDIVACLRAVLQTEK